MEFETAGFNKNPLADLMVLVKRIKDLETLRSQQEAALDETEKAINDLCLRILPQEFANLNMEEIALSDGQRLVIVEDVFANISKDRKEAAHKWLKEHGAGAIVKKTLYTEGEERVLALAKLAQDNAVPFNVEETVNPQTLKKFVRESLDSKEEIPHDLLGVHIQKRAQLKT